MVKHGKNDSFATSVLGHCGMDMQSTLINGFEFKGSRSSNDLVQSSLGLDILKSFLAKSNRLMIIILQLADNQDRHSNMLITRIGIKSQMRSNFGEILHFALEFLAPECLNNPYLTLSFI